MKVCKHCGEINTHDASYCCNCGKTKFTMKDETVCPSCGALNDKSFAHCINCGSSLSESASNITQPNESNAPVQEIKQEAAIYDTGLTSIPSETARCPHCGTMVPITAIFCSKCGSSVANLHIRRVVERKICPHCGKLNRLDANLCSYCFSSLADAETEKLHVKHESENLGDLTVRQAYLEGLGGKQLICPNCGTLNQAGEPFCVNCGLKLVADAPKKYCPNCGTENPSDSSFCSKCQWSFEGEEPDKKEKWTCPKCEHDNDKQDTYCSNCGQKR